MFTFLVNFNTFLLSSFYLKVHHLLLLFVGSVMMAQWVVTGDRSVDEEMKEQQDTGVPLSERKLNKDVAGS